MKMIDLRQHSHKDMVVNFEPIKVQGHSIICRKTMETQDGIVIEGPYKYNMNTRKFTKLASEEYSIEPSTPWYYDSNHIYYLTSRQVGSRHTFFFNQVNLNAESSVALMAFEASWGQHCQPVEFINGNVLYSILYSSNSRYIGNKQCRTFLFDAMEKQTYEVLDRFISSSYEVFHFNGVDYLLVKRCSKSRHSNEYSCQQCSTKSLHSSASPCAISIVSIDSFVQQVKSSSSYISGLMTYSIEPNCSLIYLGMNDNSIFYICKYHTKHAEELLEIKKADFQITMHKLPRSYAHIKVDHDNVFVFHENERMVLVKDVMNESLVLTYPKTLSESLIFETFSGFTENKFLFVNGCESKGRAFSYYCKIFDISTGIGVKHSGKIQSLDGVTILY